jgi:hypothetical protein
LSLLAASQTLRSTTSDRTDRTDRGSTPTPQNNFSNLRTPISDIRAPISGIMDQRELETRLKALQKAVNGKDSPSTIISILQTLQKEVVPTEELLRVRS